MNDCSLTTHISKYMILWANHNTDTQKYRCSLVKRQINYNKEKMNSLNTEANNVRNKF